MERDLAFAFELADLAESIALARFRAHDLVVDTKPDLSPVTDADRAVEAALRARIAERRPDDGVLGEEEGEAGNAAVRWILDPIDGTRNFSRGIPVWATLIALERDGDVVVGVVSAPALRRRWWAVRGGGAFADGTPIRVSQIDTVSEATVSASSLDDSEIVRRAWHGRNLGDFWQHCLVAEGAVDVAVDPEAWRWDVAAGALLVEEAGGRVTGVGGGPPDGSMLSTNGRLHEEALSLLSPG
ncbi:MAG TPA: inositol monophosphatase family protein [Gaiellaceae bacterium]